LTIIGADLHAVAAQPGPTIRDAEGIPTFRNYDGMTEIESMIATSATGCLTQREIGGKVFQLSPCGIVDELRVFLSKASQKQLLADLLNANDFRCRKVLDATICRNEFKTIETPMLGGRKVNPDFHHTFITEIAFKQVKSEAVSAADIKIEFTHLERQDSN
jgi:hypothetical protein